MANLNLSIKNRYRPEIDGLRAFAVIAVIINHFNKQLLPNGYLGVDIFFVISGFVITSSLYKKPSKNFKDLISRFYERRIKRLVPALSVYVFIMSIAICLFNPKPGISLRTGLTSLFGFSNLYLFNESTDYFAQSTELNVFTHTWSLGVEEQFYILFPFLIWFSGFGRQTKKGTQNLFLIIGALAIASLIGFLNLYPINQSAAYFLMPTRFWEISAGCLLFIGCQKRKSIEHFLEKIPPIASLALIVGIMYLPITSAAVSTAGVVFLSAILIASLKKHSIAFKIFTHQTVVYIGLISYSLYLWHWGILAISRWTIGIHWWSIPFQVTLIYGLANASYKYIETPLRKANWFSKPWKTIFFAGGILVSLSGGIIALSETFKNQLFLGKNRTITINEYEQYNFLKGEDCLEKVSKIECYLIDNKSQQTLWILGDSHANSLVLAGKQTANSLGMNLKLFSAGATTFPQVRKYRKLSKKYDLQLLDEFKLVEKKIYSQIKVGDIIFLSIRLPAYFGGSYYGNPQKYKFFREDGSFLEQNDHFSEWISLLSNFANVVQKKGAKVIIQTPTPEWEKEQNKMCSIINKQWFNSVQERNCQIKSEFFIDKETGLYNHLFEKLRQLSTSHENIYLFDTFKFVCPESTCSFIENGADIYYDGDHLSIIWAQDNLSSEIQKFIKTIQDK